MDLDLDLLKKLRDYYTEFIGFGYVAKVLLYKGEDFLS